MKIAELRSRLNKLAVQMKDMHDTAETEDRGFSAEEREKWDGMLADYEQLEQRIADAERAHRLETTPVNDPAGAGMPARGGDEGGGEQRTAEQEAEEYRGAFMQFIAGGELQPEQRQLLERRVKRAGINDEEVRALTTQTPATGGYLIPEGFAGYITESMQDFSGLYQARNRPNGPQFLQTGAGNTLPFPTNDDTANAGSILSENTQLSEQDTTFGQRTLGAFMYTSDLIRVPIQLIQDEAVNLEQYLGRILGKRLGRAIGPHLANGTGSSQPTGVNRGSDSGAGVSAATGVVYADLLDIEHALDPAYRNRGASWVFNDTILKALKNLVDGNSRPLWLPDTASALGGPVAGPTIDGFPYIIDQGMPNLANGNRYIAFGDLSEYIIREVQGVQVFRFAERYMDYLQIGLTAYARWDGNVIDTSAIVYDQAVA